MTKNELLAQLRSTCDDLSGTFNQVSPEEWSSITGYKQLSIHALVNCAMAWLELTGNWYLQSVRMIPVYTTKTIEVEAVHHAERRRARDITANLRDLTSARQGLLILLDMANEDQLQEICNGRPRIEQFVDLLEILQSINNTVHRTLGR
jgi:hypothetical protein